MDQKDNGITDGPGMTIVLHIRPHPKNGIGKKVESIAFPENNQRHKGTQTKYNHSAQPQ